MLLDELHAHKQEIDLLAAQYGARRIRVFGSVARGETQKLSFPRRRESIPQPK